MVISNLVISLEPYLPLASFMKPNGFDFKLNPMQYKCFKGWVVGGVWLFKNVHYDATSFLNDALCKSVQARVAWLMLGEASC